MALVREFRPTFERGEVSEEFLARADTEILSQSARRLRNTILLRGGGVKRRPGSTERVVTGTVTGRTWRFRGLSGAIEDLFFSNGSLKIYNTAGTLLQTITSGIPWVTADLDELVITADKDIVYVFHDSFITQVLEFGAGGTWTRSDFTFLPGAGSAVSEPFFRFEPPGITMEMGARTGSTTATFSSGFLTSNHVGARFRFLQNNQVEVTSISSSTVANVDVKDEIYPESTLTVADSSEFKVGQVCETDLDELQCIVEELPTGTTVRVVMLSYSIPDITSDNFLIGPEARQKITVVSGKFLANPSTVWDESLVSDDRGFPGTGVVHRDRLIMGGFPDAPTVVAGSAIGANTDFDVGDGLDSDAFIEQIGDQPNATVKFFASAEQLIVFTDRGAYYVPESVAAPLTPSTVAFLWIGPEGIADVAPVVATEGVVFVDEAAGRIMLAAPTGNVRRSWAIVDLSEAAYHLLNSPRRLAIANGMDGRTERYILCLNGDGTLVVMQHPRGEQIVGFALWSRGFGTWEDVYADQDDIQFISLAGSDFRLCDLDFDSLVDDEVSYTAAVSARANQEADVVDTKTVIHSGTLDGTGAFDDPAPAAGLTIGHDFDVTIETAPQIDPEFGYRRSRIVKYFTDVLDSGAYRVEDRLFWPFFGGDDLEVAGKTLTRRDRGFGLGWKEGPTLTVTQRKGEGAELELRSLTLEEAF